MFIKCQNGDFLNLRYVSLLYIHEVGDEYIIKARLGESIDIIDVWSYPSLERAEQERAGIAREMVRMAIYREFLPLAPKKNDLVIPNMVLQNN